MIIQNLGIQPYEKVWREMQNFTETRTLETTDEIWLVEHLPVYTLGLNGKREHLLNTGKIPVIQTDRGGQVTYHGVGQAIVYVLFDLKRLNLNSQQIVAYLENAMIQTLVDYEISAVARADARGVYVENKKIGSIGLRIKKNGCYHGLSLNNNMDLTPFNFINPCGYVDLQMTQMVNFGVIIETNALAQKIVFNLTKKFE
ncbi:octanoyltransferase [Methylococcaceae bacterium]|jgi:lipoyl(octanoyl) transferase|nr:lipoyl(octanoyl) transferase LipB [Methylococcales bacterium]GDX84452.1 octanoyltransferase [Methylococcaceae bacterium]